MLADERAQTAPCGREFLHVRNVGGSRNNVIVDVDYVIGLAELHLDEVRPVIVVRHAGVAGSIAVSLNVPASYLYFTFAICALGGEAFGGEDDASLRKVLVALVPCNDSLGTIGRAIRSRTERRAREVERHKNGQRPGCRVNCARYVAD